MREGNLVAVGVGTIDVVEAHGNLGHDFQISLAGLEHFGVDGIAQGRDQSIDAGFHLLDDQALGRRRRLRIDLEIIASLAQQVEGGVPNVAGGENTEFFGHGGLLGIGIKRDVRKYHIGDGTRDSSLNPTQFTLNTLLSS